MKRLLYILLVFTGCLVFGKGQVAGQSNCTSDVPFFEVDLSANASGIWESTAVSRSGNCCDGVSANCVEFLVALHPNAAGVILEIISGSQPTGSLFYQNNCGTTSPIGDSMCLTGTGPHSLIFCKPGSNANIYRLSSFSRPYAGEDVLITTSCSSVIQAEGFEESSIVWTSIYPGEHGIYNPLLSCTIGCSAPTITPVDGLPPYIDFQISGQPLTSCTVNLSDTLRFYFGPPLVTGLLPQNPTVCFDSVSTVLTASATGGFPPYVYLWNTGETGPSIRATAGTHSCSISDVSVCNGSVVSTTVGVNYDAVTANAGVDQFVCHSDSVIFLNGNITGSMGCEWTGGSGSFIPDQNTLSVEYHFSESELSLNPVTLILNTIVNDNCLNTSDTIQVFKHPKPATSDIIHY
ncbi:MAG TPA: hypothetical protein DEO70_05480 [Bacteroidales bacterium]|nr:MAG: hypothetical protein A2X11_16790 [Bacteroidetes bacterium GWE2_42_24]OFY25147.1 MAG: hypothetical protein A2X09_04950 [Bacteroidetes bacterium GWF2_43_11]HBZ66270.1 hypothetical protein [Bacteroidales bacterium]